MARAKRNIAKATDLVLITIERLLDIAEEHGTFPTAYYRNTEIEAVGIDETEQNAWIETVDTKEHVVGFGFKVRVRADELKQFV